MTAPMFKSSLVAIVMLAGIASAAPSKKPTLHLDTPIVTGKLDAKVVTATVKRSHAKLLDCYAKAHAKDGQIEAAVVEASFTIGADGKVANLVIAMDTLPAAVETCLAKILGKLQFGKRTDTVEVTLPLGFGPPLDRGAFVSITGLGDGSTGSTIYGSDESTIVTGKPRSGWGTRGGMRGGNPSPKVSVGQPTATGNLDGAIIRRYIKRNIQRLVLCYEQELATNETLAGTSTAVFVIGEDGKVSGLTVSGLDAKVDGCLASVLGAIEFPAPKGGTVRVRYPLTFSPAKS